MFIRELFQRKTCSWPVNRKTFEANVIIIDQLDPNFLTQQFNDQEYYYLPRPLNGQDTITMSFINSGADAEQLNVIVYYI